MRGAEGDDVALKLVHTADWHLGMRFPGFDEDDRKKLTRARLAVIERILGTAARCGADAVLCAGDLFDEPAPPREWWEGLCTCLRAHGRAACPVFLLPGNHDPLVAGSVWSADHPFCRTLPDFAHVVDRDDFHYSLKPEAVLYAAPCRSQAGQKDLALSLPAREPGDERIRIGLVHGSTFDLKDCQTNFPIAVDAAARRGFDYLAIGDTHGFREVPPGAVPPTVYPGAPEPTSFGDQDAGCAALVFVSRTRRVTVRRERVASWTWQERRVASLDELRALRDGEDLTQHVLRLTVDMRVPPAEYAEAERILGELKGGEATHARVGILQLDRSGLRLDAAAAAPAFGELPDALREAARRLQEIAAGADDAVAQQVAVAQQALAHLYRLTRELG